MPPLNVSGGDGGASSARVLPAVSTPSFLYYDMRQTVSGTDLIPGQASANIKNLGHGGAIDFDAGHNSGTGLATCCVAPAGGLGVDVGGSSGNQGMIATSLTTAPDGSNDTLLSVALRFRAGFGIGSPIIFTKSYIAVGGSWAAPFNAFGFSLESALNGQFDANINIGGTQVGTGLAGRFVLPPDTDLWLDLRKSKAGTTTVFMQGSPVVAIATAGDIDWGAGEWMLGGNIHTAADSINGAIYFAELLSQNGQFSDAFIRARARAWLGWS